MEKGDINWLALESNPQIINEYTEKLGFETTYFNFQDMVSFDDFG